MSVQPTCTVRRHPDVAPRGFSITELLVVIGIIVLLIGILLPALGRVREKARVTETTSVMEEFAKACDAFNQQFGFYPGIVPEEYLANDPKITPMENAVLHLAGGAVRQDELPVFIDGVQYNDLASIQFEPGNSASDRADHLLRRPLRRVPHRGLRPGGRRRPLHPGQAVRPVLQPEGRAVPARQYNLGEEGTLGEIEFIPTVTDAWGQPVMYARRLRSTGPLVGYYTLSSQFSYDAQGRVLDDRRVPRGLLPEPASVQHPEPGLTRTSDPKLDTFAQVLRTPAIGFATQPQSGAPRGEYILISPGPDGVFFKTADGPGSPGQQVPDIISGNNDYGTPTVVDEYDDIIVAGGG